jgi:hypothetical protein
VGEDYEGGGSGWKRGTRSEGVQGNDAKAVLIKSEVILCCVSDISVSVDAALSELDPEVSSNSPACAPTVGDNPVFLCRSLIDTPSDDLDGVASSNTSGLVDVNSALVAHEIVVDGESGLDWATLDNGLLDVRWVIKGLELGSLVEDWCGAIVTGGWACAGVATSRFVADAGKGWDSVALEIVPGDVEPPSVTAHVAGIAADEPLWAESYDFVTLEAEPIAKSL